MTVLLSLYVLALLDYGFAGFRVAAGRDGRIVKRDYYRVAILRGLGLGALWLCVGTGCVVFSASFFPGGGESLTSAGVVALWVYGAYATVVLLAFLPYLLGGLELRTLATVALLGPCTMLRLPVIIVGALAGLWTAPGWVTLFAATYATWLGLCAEPILDRWRRVRSLP